MIPTMLLAGLVIGRWWVIPVGGAAWALLVVFAVPAPGDVLLAAALGAANAAVGVLIRSGCARLARGVARLTRFA